MSEQASAPAAAAAPASESSAPAAAENVTAESQQAEGQEQATPAKKPVPKFRKFKVGNEEVALSDEDIARDYAKWRGADQKFREAAEARTALEKFQKAFEEDPQAVLDSPKIPAAVKKKLAEKWLVDHVEREVNPPDPRDVKLSEAEKRIKEFEDKERQEQEAKQTSEQRQVIEQRRNDIGNILREAGKLTPLSATPEDEAALIREMATYMRSSRERGENPTPQEVAEHIHNQRFKQFYTLAHQFEGDQLIDYLGEEIVKRIRKADLTRLRKAREPEAQHHNPDAVTQRRETKEVKRMDPFEARQHARKVLGV